MLFSKIIEMYIELTTMLRTRIQLKRYLYIGLGLGLVFNATFNNISVISWQSVLVVEENGVHGENRFESE